MQSLSTFSKLTAKELVHLHRHKSTEGLELAPISVQSVLATMPRSSLCVRMKAGIWKSISIHKLNAWLTREVTELKLNAFQHHCAYFSICIEQASKPVQTFTKRVLLHLQSLRRSGVKQRTLLLEDVLVKTPLSRCPGFWLHKCTFSYLWIAQRFIHIHTDCYTTEGDCIFMIWWSDAWHRTHCNGC